MPPLSGVRVIAVEQYGAAPFNHNKKGITLDLSRPQGYEVLRRLVAGGDALVSNLRGDVPARLGLTYEQLARTNPKLVCAHLSAYGREGERAAGRVTII